MKKLFPLLKVILIILVAILLVCAGVVFYAYTKINNVSDYVDKFAYNYAAHQEEERNFDSCVYYDAKNMVFSYDVPAYYMYDVITPESLKAFLGFPDEFVIPRVAVEPDFDNMKARLYLSVKYRELLNTCMIIDTDLVLSEDERQLEMRFDDFYVVNEQVTDSLKSSVGLEKGKLMYAHRFPNDVSYYMMDRYYPEFVKNLSFDGDTIHAEYDFAKAMRKYLEENPQENVSYKEYLDMALAEVEASGIAHS